MFRRSFLPLLLLLVILSTSVMTADGNNNGLDTARRNPGMKGLYDMTRSFLDDVQTYTIGDLLRDYNVETADDFEKLMDNWREWAPEFLGFVVCVAVGVIFVPIITIFGCCYCCCRTCCNGCCCRKVKTTKPSKGWVYTCAGLSLGTSIIMFSLTICAYVSTSLVVDELSGLMLQDVATSIRTAESFAHDAADDVDDMVLTKLGVLNEDIEKSLIHLPDTIMAEIDNMTGVDTALTTLSNFTGDLPALEKALEDMDATDLGPLEVILEGEINPLRSGDLATYLATCAALPLPECGDAAADLANLQTTPIATELTDTTVAQAAVGLAITDDVDQNVNDLIANLDQVNDEIKAEIEGTITQVLDELDKASETVNDSLSEVLATFRDVDLEGTAVQVEEVSDTIEPYAQYYGYALYGLTSVILLISVLWLAGGSLGFVSHTHGANLLLAGVGFQFIFAWLLMLVTVMTFMLGGAMEVVACRHLVGFDEDAQKIVQIAQSSFAPDFNYNITVKEVLDNCQADQAVYEALNLEQNGFNITELLDLDQYGVYDMIESLKNVTFNIGTVDVINPALNDSMYALDAALDSIAYDDNLEELAKPITTVDLVQFKADLDGIVDALASTDPVLSVNIAAEAAKVQGIIDGSYADVQTEREEIQDATETGKELSDISLVEIMETLDKAQTSLNEDLDGLISDILGMTVDELILAIEEFIVDLDKSIRNDMIKCRPIFDVFQSVVYAECVYFLYPFNALWYCYGACLFLSLPGIVFATKTVGYFRRLRMQSKVYPGTAMEVQNGIDDYEMSMMHLQSGSVKKNAVAPI